jgi:hypothetical protein
MKKFALNWSDLISGPIDMRGVLSVCGIFLLVMGLSIFFGLIAVTTNPVFIAVGVGLLAAPLLLAKPDWNIWIILVGGILVTGLLPLWVDWVASKMVWVISLLGFVLMLSALFRLGSVSKTIIGTPTFVWLALAFMLFTIINGLVQWSSFFEFVSSFKRYFQAIGLLFALVWLGFTEKIVRLWRIFFIIAVLAQLPWALYQLVVLVPIREGLAYTYDLVPIDIVAGTFGSSMYGGGANANMATFLIIALAFLLSHRREKLLGLGNYLMLLPFVIIPLFMGETKVVIILLPIMFLTLYRREFISRPHQALLALVMCTILTLAVSYAYFEIRKFNSFNEFFINTMDYNVYKTGYGSNELNRTTVLTFWMEQQGAHDPVSAIFGNGSGAANDETHGKLASRYSGYGIGLTAASILLWEQGPFGAVLFLSILGYAWCAASRIKYEAVQAWMRADAAAIEASLPLFAFYLIYSSVLLNNLPFQIFFYSLLGYLAWLYRQHIAYVCSKP